jgi:hypothetical protein
MYVFLGLMLEDIWAMICKVAKEVNYASLRPG